MDVTPRHLGKAYSLFPGRPESYIVYKVTRRKLRLFVDQKENLSTFASSFLKSAESCSYWDKYPLLFCCSCVTDDYYQLIPLIVRAEQGNLLEEFGKYYKQHEPGKHRTASDLLSLVATAEALQQSREKYKTILKEMRSVADDVKYYNSPVYPLIVDHLFQIECSQDDKHLAEGNQDKYIKNYVGYYKGLKDTDPIVPPGKTFIFYLVNDGESNAFPDLINMLKDFKKDSLQCMSLIKENEVQSISKKLKDLDNAPYENLSIESYLSKRMRHGWMKLRKYN